ncbi:MAG: homocitrate synthase [Bacteroidetes bacterium]|nr:homocitrate synthase [Bacteroidota bacterium]
MDSLSPTFVPRLIDSTLRDGEQAPGVAFSRAEKLKVVRLLDAVGVDEIEAGTPAMGEEEVETIRSIVRAKSKCRISVWSRALRQDIEMAARTGAEGIHMAFPLSDIQLKVIGKDWVWISDALPALVEYAHRYFSYVSVGAQDASRTDRTRLFAYLKLIQNAGVKRVRIADTVGLFTPLSLYSLVRDIKTAFPLLEIDFHGHNDLGMATANAITAWQAGAENLSVTVNGLGERAGNSSLEEVVTTLVTAFERTEFHPEKLMSLCNFVSACSGRPIPVGKAITGSMVFTHESGIHAQGTLRDAKAFQLFDGKLVGRESAQNVFGKHSGKTAVLHFFSQRNLLLDAADLDSIVGKIHQLSIFLKRNLSVAEMLAVYDEVHCK